MIRAVDDDASQRHRRFFGKKIQGLNRYEQNRPRDVAEVNSMKL